MFDRLDESLFNKNVLMLKDFNPDLIVSTFDKDEKQQDKYEVLRSSDGNYTVKTNDDRQFLLHSKFNPLREAKTFVEGYYKYESKVFVLFGFGLGYAVQELLKVMAAHQTLHVLDLNTDVFKLSLGLFDFSEVFKDTRLKLWVGSDLKVFSQKLSLVLERNENCELIIHQPSLNFLSDVYQDIKQVLDGFLMFQRSVARFGSMMKENYRLNKAILKQNGDVFFGKFVNKPILVVSAGPSLTKNIGLLKVAKEKCLILCVGRALRALIAEGVDPDFVIFTDPQDIVREQIRGLENLSVPALFLATCNYLVVREYRGPKFALCQSEEFFMGEGANQLVATGGSVSTTALDIAIQMGGNPIVLVGQDLAFSGNQHHAEGTLYEKGLKMIDETVAEKVRVKGWAGGEVSSTAAYVCFREWISKRAEKEASRVFINATEGGAYIEGFEHITLSSFLDSL